MKWKMLIMASCFMLLAGCSAHHRAAYNCNQLRYCYAKNKAKTNECPCTPCDNYYPCIDHVDKCGCEDP